MNFFLVSSKTIFLPHITIPGHVAQKSASLIDTIFINNYKGKCLFWQHNNRYLVSNHHPQFLVIKNFYEINVNDNQISKESLRIIIQMNLKKRLYHLNSRYRKTIDKHALLEPSSARLENINWNQKLPQEYKIISKLEIGYTNKWWNQKLNKANKFEMHGKYGNKIVDQL